MLSRLPLALPLLLLPSAAAAGCLCRAASLLPCSTALVYCSCCSSSSSAQPCTLAAPLAALQRASRAGGRGAAWLLMPTEAPRPLNNAAWLRA